MNDKNRDWVDGAVKNAFDTQAMWLKSADNNDTDEKHLALIIRSHIPPQPPITENARDWKSNYIRALNAWAETNGKLSFTPEIAETLLRQFAPAQPPTCKS